MMLFCSVFLFALFPLFFASEDVFAADDDVTTYTVLVLDTSGQAVAEFFKMTARDLASVDESFYEIYDPSQLDLGFEDVADSVTDILTFPFNDVRYSDWYYRSVKYVWKHNLMQGTSPGKFSPEIATTRAMIVMVLYNFEGNPTVRTENTFKDVAVGTWYNDAVTWAQNNGIVLGFSPERFGPEVNITREQMAAILYRYADYKNFDTSPRAVLYHYRDWNKISKYAFDYMAWANAKGYIQGTSPSTLSPRNEATRAQVAAIFHRFFRDVL